MQIVRSYRARCPEAVVTLCATDNFACCACEVMGLMLRVYREIGAFTLASHCSHTAATLHRIARNRIDDELSNVTNSKYVSLLNLFSKTSSRIGCLSPNYNIRSCD
jgi:hypothetical protein